MKKYILMGISLLLIVASILFLPKSVDPDVIAGPGDGQNAKIKDMDDFNEVMDYFLYGENSSSTYSEGGVKSTAELIRAKSHSSGTIIEESNANFNVTHRVITDYNYEFNGYDFESNPTYATVGTTTTTFNRTLAVYMDGDSSYYVSKGMMKTNYVSNHYYEDDENSYTKMVWDFQMLIDGDDLFIKFDSFVYDTDGEDVVNFSDLIGKWVEVPDEVTYELLILLDTMNRDSLSTIQKLINSGLEDMVKSGNIYTLKTATYDENDTKITLDLSNEEISSLKMVVDANSETVNGTLRDFITFSNIDNTVVENNISDYESPSLEEFEEMLGG